jgi:hypothetical protein
MCSFRISGGTPIILLDDYRGFPQPQADQDITFIRPRPLPPNHFQLVIHESSYEPTACSPDTDSVVSRKKN